MAPLSPSGHYPQPSPAPERLGLPHDPGAPPRSTLRREWLLLVLALTVLLAVVAPPLINLGRYQHRIVASMSRSLGRDVTMRAVTLRLLPMPALVMTDVLINEEVGFGAEPALRAPTVVAELRLVSLWRGRLEISRVELSDASLNLVRDQAGRWNVGSLLLQASHMPNAPTGQRRPGPAPRFPYIQITDSRVNVKQGVEKLPYSLLNTNLSMWLAEPDLWQIRLDGQPVRTDIELGLSDTGTLHIEGRLHRATALGHMPLALHAEWTNAPLGQASRLLLGQDRGWRGDLRAAADVAGDLDNLDAKTKITIVNLHREEFSPLEPFTVDATCRAIYSRAARTLRDLACRWPIGHGQLLLAGNLGPGIATNETPGPASTLAMTADQVPASFLVALAGLARSDFAPAFRLEGDLAGSFFFNALGKADRYTGMLEAPRLQLVADGLPGPLELTGTRLAIVTPSPSGSPTLILTAAPVALGGAVPVRLSAQASTQGFLLHASGGASLARMEELGRATHLLPTAMAWLAAQGNAEFDVTRAAGWQDGEPAVLAPASGAGLHAGPPRGTAPTTSGWLRLQNAQYAPRFLAQPILVPSAQAVFLPGRITWTIPSALFGQTDVQIKATYPLNCIATQDCVTRFEANCATLDQDDLIRALLGDSKDAHLFDQLMNRLDDQRAHLPPLAGTVHAGAFTLGRLVLHNATAEVSSAQGQIAIKSLDAQALGGTLHTEGTVALAEATPSYDLSVSLTRASAPAAGMLFHEDWGSGALNVRSQVRLRGLNAAQLAASATGRYHAEWTRGGLGLDTPLQHFALWTADGLIAKQTLTVTHGELTGSGPGASMPLTGNIGFDRALALHFEAGEGGRSASRSAVSVTGTLKQPGAQAERP